MKDLFGYEVDELPKDKGRASKYQIWRNINYYRRAEDKEMSCETCKNRATRHPNKRQYHKCILIGMSFSSATDIRLRDICNRWEKAV